jgi:dipeptidyl aminopeptidase/acylaminoacyl peptidase
VWTYDVFRQSLRRATHSATAGISPDTFVQPQLVHFATFDGRRIPAWLYAPTGARPDGTNRVVIEVHGGPEAQERPIFTPVFQYLASRGYCVVAPNVRGSTGYGRTYVHLDDVRQRTDAVKDIKHLWQWLVESKWAHPKRVAIWGASYGGFMTLASITTYPELWAAAVDVFGIANFITFLQNTSAYRRKLRAAEYGDPERDADFLREISPIHHIDRIRAPLLAVHGVNDPRVPIDETEQIVRAVKERGGIVEYMRFEDEGHGIVKKANRLRAYSAIADFLDRHLKGP